MATNKIVNLITGASGAGTAISPYNATQFKNDIGLTGDASLIEYSLYGYKTFTDYIDIKRANVKIKKYDRTPPRIKFLSTGAAGFRIINTNGVKGLTSEMHVAFDQCMIEKESATGSAGAVIDINNQCTGSNGSKIKLTVDNSFIRADFNGSTGSFILDLSAGDNSNSYDIKGCDFVAADNVGYGINLNPSVATSVVNIDSCYFEGNMIPVRKTAVSSGSYQYSCFRNTMDVRYKNSGLVHYNYDAVDNTIQFGSAVDLSNCITGDQFLDSSLNNYSIARVYDGLDKIQIGAITGDVNDTTPTEFRQGSIIRRYHPISIGIGGTGGSTGALPAGIGNKDGRMLPSSINFSNYSILNMVLPTALMPTGGAVELNGQANPSLGLTQDILGEVRGTGDIGCKEYRRVLNDFETMPARDGVNVKSTINKAAVVAMTDFDTYFDSESELCRVDVWYVHEDGRQEKHLIHQGGAGGPLTCRVNWTSMAKEGVWKKTRINLIGWNGAELMLRGRVTNTGYEDIIIP